MHRDISFTDTCREKAEVQSQVQVIYYQNPIACCTLIISSVEYKWLKLAICNGKIRTNFSHSPYLSTSRNCTHQMDAKELVDFQSNLSICKQTHACTYV